MRRGGRAELAVARARDRSGMWARPPRWQYLPEPGRFGRGACAADVAGAGGAHRATHPDGPGPRRCTGALDESRAAAAAVCLAHPPAPVAALYLSRVLDYGATAPGSDRAARSLGPHAKPWRRRGAFARWRRASQARKRIRGRGARGPAVFRGRAPGGSRGCARAQRRRRCAARARQCAQARDAFMQALSLRRPFRSAPEPRVLLIAPSGYRAVRRSSICARVATTGVTRHPLASSTSSMAIRSRGFTMATVSTPSSSRSGRQWWRRTTCGLTIARARGSGLASRTSWYGSRSCAARIRATSSSPAKPCCTASAPSRFAGPRPAP